jgi:dienelactone hydrolase
MHCRNRRRMKKFFVIAAVVIVTKSVAQKAPMPLDAYKHWSGIFNERISDDGKYVVYQEKLVNGKVKTVAVSTDGTCEKELQHPQNDTFRLAEQVKVITDNKDQVSDALLPEGFKVRERSNARFNYDSTMIFVELVKIKPETSAGKEKSTLTIWKSTDDSLPPMRTLYSQYSKTYYAAMQPARNKTLLINNDSDEITVLPSPKDKIAYALALSNKTNNTGGKKQWIFNPLYTIKLVSLHTGKRESIGNFTSYEIRHFSPGGKFVLGYNPPQHHYFSYEISSRRIRSLNEKVKQPLYDVNDDQPGYASPYGIAAWTKNGRGVYVYDEFDIWKLSLDNSAKPENVTKGYGRKNKIVLRLLNITVADADIQPVNLPELPEDTTVYLTGFNKETKQNGFFSIKTGSDKNPLLLHMNDHYFACAPPDPSFQTAFPYAPVYKSKNAPVYLLRRQSANEYPNLFVTSNFREFRQLTNVAPHAQYNWMTSELITYPDASEKKCQAILYKPEDFDSVRAYPVIFTVYERQSDALHFYLHPEATGGELNVPTMVSNGYIVIAPDIRYKTGETGESALRAIDAVAAYVSKKKWINAQRMALYGHSFGGYEVNYMLTKTNRFAAAIEAAGLCDMVSMYDDIRMAQGISHQFYFETGQGRIRKTLWEQPELYIKNSPLFGAPKVTTPLLIMHNEGDQQVAWNQGIEWFNALRRLGKNVWMLQYKGEGHFLQQEENKLDYTRKIIQYFDHYLKGAPAPEWMK